MDWTTLFYGLFAIFALWLLHRMITTNPDAFSKSNLSKSAMTLGYLALALIAFVVLCIMLLRQS